MTLRSGLRQNGGQGTGGHSSLGNGCREVVSNRSIRRIVAATS
ncbi:MAG: hypothetical protein QOJ03_2241, partial [Frankiaceae bacterium]|nr:hypothetical protein [Frankiaceae bacterium]